MAVIVKIRRGTTAQWASSTKVLQVGELGIDTTLNKIKAGNGSSLWSALPWLIVSPDELTTQASATLSDANTYTDTAVSSLGNSLDGQYVEVGDVGVADGVASLGPDGKIPDSEIPSGIARDSEIITSYNDLTDKPSIALGAVKWTANHTLLPGGENTRYLAGDIVWDGGNIYVANYDNESIPTSSTLYWTNIGAGKRLNIDGRDIPNIIWDNILEKPTIPSLTGYATETYVNTAVSNLVDTAPETLNTLNELAAAINDDASFASTVTTALGNKLDSSTASSTYLTQTDASTTYAPINSPTFTGTVGGITKSMIDLANVDNTSDANKPVSTATQTALDLKLDLSSPSVDYYITNSGSGAYVVNGVSNGLITFEKGKKYRIHINASGHPFWIQTVSGAYSAGNVYSTGITNGGAQVGHILVELPQNAPDDLYYVCQYHSSMQGSISVQSQNTITINSKSSSYTILPVDSGKLIEMSAGGTLTITDSASFPVGYSIDVLQTGSSQVTIAGDGFTPNATPGLKLRTQWSSATLIKRALNSWVVLGDLSA
jgi:hypothetical protein